MKIFKNIITFIFTIILTILILSYVIIKLCSSTVLNENYVISKLEENDYYNKTYELVESNFENYIQQYGLDEEVLKDIITKDEIEEDTKSILNNIYSGIGDNISTEKIKERLTQNIDKSLENKKLSSSEKEAIDDFIDKIGNEYETTIFHTNYEKSLSNMYKKIIKMVSFGEKVILVSIGFFVILILIINTRRIYKSISAIGISMISSGVIFIIAKIYINTKIKIQTITVLNSVCSTTLRNILQELLDNIITYGIIFSVIGLVLIILSNLIHNIKKYGLEEEL